MNNSPHTLQFDVIYVVRQVTIKVKTTCDVLVPCASLYINYIIC